MDDLEVLIGAWLTVPEVAQSIGVADKDVRRMIEDGLLLAHRVGRNQAVCVPAAFVREGQVLPALSGTITVLHDSGLSREESLRWLFTPDDSLPVVGSPVTMLQQGRKSEIRKRAAELAW